MKDLQKLVGNLNKSGALSGLLGGVAGSGLTSMMGGKSKKTGKKAIKYGALAAIGGLAWKAYKQYSEQKPTTAKPTSSRTFDFTPAVMPEHSFNEVIDDNHTDGQLLLMRAMIAAAYADGHIDDTERQKIFAQVDTLELSAQEKAMLFDELRKPMQLSELVNAVPNAQMGIEVYVASASAIDLNQSISKHYLEALANQLCIPNELVDNIHQQLPQ
ncbi:tellurite resistance TerB family protein [Pseudoalteromonas sp. N1230-9]|uniref:tellurite resistance TerB family protein n=1 Tax=unclassified Pseudoalteromonas TaxID=194690 RepID=UPI002B2A4CCA|nr:tellurite resistance TerB family protein [Pseudoalteromonas sp. N1230-9]